MLYDFLTSNRAELIDRCRSKVLLRRAPRATPAELHDGVPLFLAQLTATLPGGNASDAADAQMESAAARHGSELRRHDFTIEQVVHDYGDLCQSITELAVEQNAPITAHEFGILNIRLDNAIAGAVSEYTRQHDMFKADVAVATNERLGVLGYEMRNLLNTAILAIAAIKRGSVGFGGATAAALDRSLINMRGLIDRSLAEVRLAEGSSPQQELIEIGEFISDVQVAATLEASHKGCELSVGIVEAGICVQGDRHILASAVANLIQNALKFTRSDCHVIVRAYAAKNRVCIEVEDDGPGVPGETAEQLRQPAQPYPTAHRGMGLGLAICRRGVEAMGGTLAARNIEDTGCIFTIDLPQARG